MSDLIQQADAIRNLAKLFKNMSEAADTLESIGTLDQALQERKASLAVIDAQLDAVKAAAQSKLDEAQHALDVANADSAQIIVDAGAVAVERIAGADLKVARMLADAATQIEAGNAKAIADAESRAADAVARAVKARADADEARALHNELAPQIATQQIELARLTDAIAAARATMAQIMGAQ